jgi:hypothetical protein
MAPDPRVRKLGEVEDIDGQGLSVGVDYDTVSIGLAEFGRSAPVRDRRLRPRR